MIADYRETAAKFQKEWHVNEPHRDFPFAPHVKSQALVSVVNRGLIYYALEREFALSKVSPFALLFFPLSLPSARGLLCRDCYDVSPECMASTFVSCLGRLGCGRAGTSCPSASLVCFGLPRTVEASRQAGKRRTRPCLFWLTRHSHRSGLAMPPVQGPTQRQRQSRCRSASLDH